MDQDTAYVVDTETAGETYDDEAAEDVAFLAPRLAAYAPTSGNDDDDDDTHPAVADAMYNDDDDDDDNIRRLFPTYNGPDGDVDNEEEEENDQLYQATHAAIDEDASQDDEPTATVHSASSDAPDESAENENDEVDLSSFLAVSRVRELLKYEGSASIVAKSAAQAAAEAVVLILRDLTKTAAEQAVRKKRKTVTYDDVARVAQLYDRFSYLADTLPPSESTSGKAVQVGRSTAAGGTFLHPQPEARATAPREKKTAKKAATPQVHKQPSRTTAATMKHPAPGEATFKQTSLRF